MKDRHGREIEYLRISITDRCNLRCDYCMPRDGVVWVAHEDLLTFEEILRLVRAMIPLGIRRVRLTGGEPLARLDLPVLIERLNAIDGIEQVNMTTNGVLFAPLAKELKRAGLYGINFSLDTLDRDVFKRITGVDALGAVRNAIDCALDMDFPRIKINCVPVRGVNDGELCAIAALAKDAPIDVRFIEMMPIGRGKKSNGVPIDEVRQRLEACYGTPTTYDGVLGNGPADYVSFPDFCGHIGFIGAVSHAFCSRCNRVRLTAEGYLKTCLHYHCGVDLRTPLRSALPDSALTELIRSAIENKPEHHTFTACPEDTESTDEIERHNMNAIGG